ncbi:MAG TPA: tRNA (adenosine(37)-N6)-threonylcarbamoyltransferase complex dimerization subunit type 1 TsaB [candidate division Zixibacteria bacterium]|nr:tRNA (adenosine(37)-N6)-threonylcarbamoyltransferase complex dimerization subunit type 1 TsaB [candidate division Zixibacteria bacterium]
MIDFSLANVLAIDTSSHLLRLALQFGGDRLVKSEEDAGQSHGQMLIRKIQNLLESANLQPSDLQALVVATGPGSFTGLRIGIAVAKGMAVAQNLPVAGVSLLDVAEAKLARLDDSLNLLIPFKRDEFFITKPLSGCFNPGRVGTIAVEKIPALIRNEPTAVVGLDPSRVAAYENSPLQVVAFDAADLLHIGVARLLKSGGDDLETLEPLYIQKSQAEIRFDRRQHNG